MKQYLNTNEPYLNIDMRKYMTMPLSSMDLTMAKIFSEAEGWYCSLSAATWASRMF